jgi:parvulin-like peptidyl-prolyl isomerase
MKNSLYKLGLLILLYTSLSCFAQKNSLDWDKAGPLASVDGRIITLIDVLKVCGAEESRLPYMYEEKELNEQVHTLRMLTLEEIIKQKIVFNEFLSRGYGFPVGFMHNYLDQLAVANKMNSMAQLKKMIEANGENFEDFKQQAYEKVAVNSLIYQKCYKNVFITPKEVYEYYKKNIDRFTIPEQVELQVLKLNRKGAHRKRLNSLADQLKKDFQKRNERIFNESVLMYSEGPATQIGGNIGWIYRNKLRKDFAKPLKFAKKGDIVGPVKAKEAYYFLRINNEKTKKVESYTDSKNEITHMLTAEEKREEYDAYIRKLRSKANITYY